jgi:hypothetical protein
MSFFSLCFDLSPAPPQKGRGEERRRRMGRGEYVLFFECDGFTQTVFDASAQDVGYQDIDDGGELVLSQGKIRLISLDDHQSKTDQSSPEFTGCE